MKHTQEQLANWKVYEEVRLEGRYNMFDPNARILTGLDKEEYLYCMKNYSTLQEQSKAEETIKEESDLDLGEHPAHCGCEYCREV